MKDWTSQEYDTDPLSFCLDLFPIEGAQWVTMARGHANERKSTI